MKNRPPSGRSRRHAPDGACLQNDGYRAGRGTHQTVSLPHRGRGVNRGGRRRVAHRPATGSLVAVTDPSANRAAPARLTQETYDRLQAELEDLTTRGRVEIAQAIEAARALGDLSENGDYHAAKDSQGKMESRVRQLQALLKTATVVRGDRCRQRHGGPRHGRHPALRRGRRGRHPGLLRRVDRGAPGRHARGVAQRPARARPSSAGRPATRWSTKPPEAPSGWRS